MKIGLFWRVLPVHILIIGACMVPVWQRHEAKAVAQRAATMAEASLARPIVSDKPARLEGIPIRVLVPRLTIDVAVVQGVFDEPSKTWSVAKSAANYAPNTGLVNNEKDTSLIYGHWTRDVLGPTKDLVEGDIVYVYTDNNHVFKYSFTGNEILKPTDVQIFDRLNGKPGLALMTCAGNWAQNRRIMYFKLEDAK